MCMYKSPKELVLTTEQKAIRFNLPEHVGNNFKQKGDFIKKWFYQE